MTVAQKGTVGSGIFTIPEVARILDLSSKKVSYWLKEYWNNKFKDDTGVQYSWGGKHQAINFHTLVEFYIYYQLREFGIHSKKIHEAHNVLSQVLDTSYPFAHAKLLTDGKTIFFTPDIHSVINADKSLQLNLKEVIQPFCNKIEFQDGLATKFYPLGKKYDIVVDPSHQFGTPTIKNTNIKAATIYSLFRSGETVDAIAKHFEISPRSIRHAITYFNAA